MYFPNWATSRLHWRAVGERIDRLKGRTAVTVFYEWGKERIAYTIIGTPTLKEPAAPETWLDGTAMRTLTLNGRLIVTWRRAGDGLRPVRERDQGLGAADARGVEGPGGSLISSRATRWRARCRRVVIVASRTRSARAASR